MKQPNRKLTLFELRDHMKYDPETGIFIRLKSRFKKYVGKQAGFVNEHGYVILGILGNVCRAHQLAWLYIYGEYPSQPLDHIDGDRANNAIQNLRLTDVVSNSHNIHKAYSNNVTTGLLGANYCKTNKKYLSRIMVKGKMHNLGRFSNAIDAHNAYMTAKAELHPSSTAAKKFINEGNKMSQVAMQKLRPLASIPQKAGFLIIGVRKDGAEAELTVYVDKDGFHKVPGYDQLAGWRLP